MTTNFMQKEWQQAQDSTTGWELLEYLRQLLEAENVSIVELQYLPLKRYVDFYDKGESQHPNKPSIQTCNSYYTKTQDYHLVYPNMLVQMPQYIYFSHCDTHVTYVDK